MPFEDEIIEKVLESVGDDVRDGFRPSFTPRGDAFRVDLHDADLAERDAVATSDAVVAVPWWYQCTHTGSFLGVPATHVDLDLRGTTFVRVIGLDPTDWSFHRYIDFLGALHQIGVTTNVRPALTPEEFQVYWEAEHADG